MSSTGHNTVSGAVPRGALALAAALLITPAVATAQDEAVPKRLDRKINVMEKVLNEVLRESPHWLVGGGGDYTRSVYLEEFGVIFSFDASLVDQDMHGVDIDLEGLSFLEDLKNIRIEQDGDKVIVFRDSDKDGEQDKDQEEEKGLTVEELREKRQKREADRYEQGKDELIETLLDYGDTLTELRNDQFVAITAFLENIDLLEEDDITHLIIQAKVSDLRQLGDGALTREQMLTRIRVKEY
jgi:hypothetical protein